jgi:hypothetical protein
MRAAHISPLRQWRIADEAARVGHIVAIDANGRPLVTVSRIVDTPTIARCLVRIPRQSTADLDSLPPVVVVFEEGDPAFPIIVGWVYDRIVDESRQVSHVTVNNSVPEALIDGDRIVLRSEREIVLECGRSSIVLTKDGKVVIKGTHLVSRSAGPNKIKGSTVNIN